MAAKAYKCNVECKYLLNNKAITLENNFIKAITIVNMYEQYAMPVIYLSLALPSDIYTKILKNEKSGQFILTLKMYNAYSDTALENNTINGKFTYVPSSSNPNYTETLDNQEAKDNSYKSIYVALFNMDLLNKSKTSFNGIFGEIDTSTLIYKALEDLKNVIVQPPKYNTEFDTETIPALNTRKKMLQYIFNQSPFYDTNFIFFMDFNQTYLVDMTGEATKGSDNQLSKVIIDVTKLTEEEAFTQGISVVNGAYVIYVNPANMNVTPNKGQDKVANQIVNVTEDGVIDYSNLEINNNIGSKAKQTFKRGQNPVLTKNIMESNTVIIEFKKEFIDGSIFTPNKHYMVKNYEGYTQYNGDYTLSYRREVIINDNGSFKPSVYVGLRKIGNIQEIGVETSDPAGAKLNNTSNRYTNNPDTKGSVQPSASAASTRSRVIPNGIGGRTVSLNYYSSNKRQVNRSFAGPLIQKEARSKLDTLQRNFEFS